MINTDEKMKKDLSFFESPFLGIGYTIMVLFSNSLLLLILSARDTSNNAYTNRIILIFILGLFPILVWILLIHRGFSRIRIDGLGLSKSLFRIFYKKKILWQEIQDVRVLSVVEQRIYFSRISLDSISLTKINNHKDIIHLPLTADICKAIKQYSPREIDIIEEFLRGL